MREEVPHRPTNNNNKKVIQCFKPCASLCAHRSALRAASII